MAVRERSLAAAVTRYHVVGIGGAGMSAVARLLMEHGEVSGSDRGKWLLSEALRPLGVTVHESFAEEHVSGADIVVRSSAYGNENAEVLAAAKFGLPLWRRHDAWRFLARDKRVLAVAGTHGKTTTTAMAWTALWGSGVDASLICGAALSTTGTNAHLGRSDILVIEADEYDRVFQALEPQVAVVLNVDHDHVDLFPTPQAYAAAFRTFAQGLRPGGTLVVCADDKGSSALASHITATAAVLSYGRDESADVRLTRTERGLSLSYEGQTAGFRLVVPGAHNELNAAAAVAAAVALGVSLQSAAQAVSTFGGTSRRLERLGTEAGVTVIDDYAHHPAEISASIQAVSQLGRVLVVFQPHTPSRLVAFFDGFAKSLREAAVVIVAETFSSAREGIDPTGGARALATAAHGDYARDPHEAAAMLLERVQPGDVVLILGAGDIRPAGERLLELLSLRATQ